MELGRHSPTGSGELWMQVDDTHIAQTMHEVLLRSVIIAKYYFQLCTTVQNAALGSVPVACTTH